TTRRRRPTGSWRCPPSDGAAVSVAAKPARPPRRMTWLQSDTVAGWAFAGPAVILIILFGIIPIVWSALLSFQRTNLLTPPEWIGWANYAALSKDPLFKASVEHSVIYTVLFVPLSVAGGLLTAIALNRRIRGIRMYRTAVFV